jgi:hypothetical protein
MDNSVGSQSSNTTAPHIMAMGAEIFHIPGQEPNLPQPLPAPPPEPAQPAQPALPATPRPNLILNKDIGSIHLELN